MGAEAGEEGLGESLGGGTELEDLVGRDGLWGHVISLKGESVKLRMT